MDTERYRSICYDENNIHFVMVLEIFGEAYHILNFLCIPTSKSFIHKTIHKIELFLGSEEIIKDESMMESIESEVINTCNMMGRIDKYKK